MEKIINNKISVLALFFSFLALLIAGAALQNKALLQRETMETAYDRIMRNRTIRCAYQTWPPFFIKDLNTGKFSGAFYDLFEKIGQDLSLKINWVEEVGGANIFDGFKTGRYDLFCSVITPSPERSLVSDFSKPLGYVPFYLYAREGDSRFDNAYGNVNNESITMMTMDGDLSSYIMKESFPKAKIISLPNLTNSADVLMNVAYGKADATISDSTIAREFMKSNPGKVKQVSGDPIRFPVMTFAMPIGEDKLRRMFDITVTHYLETGVIDNIYEKYGIDESKILRVAKPYNSMIGKHE